MDHGGNKNISIPHLKSDGRGDVNASTVAAA